MNQSGKCFSKAHAHAWFTTNPPNPTNVPFRIRGSVSALDEAT